MKVLALDTSTSATVVALCDLPGVENLGVPGSTVANALELRDDPPPNTRPRHTTHLLPLVAEVLTRSQSSWEEIELLAVGAGPGTFTGLRIGVATARALAQARRLPLSGVSTLASLGLDVATPALAVLDARRGEAFLAGWDADGSQTFAPAAVSPDQLAEASLSLGSPMAVGGGAVAFREVLERAGATVPADEDPVHRVSALHHCRLAPASVAAVATDVRPVYLRAPDAKPTTPRT